MDTSIYVLITLVLVGLVGLSLWRSRKVEGLDSSYNEQTCLSLAQNNAERIKDLSKKVDTLMDLENDVLTTKTQCNATTQNVSQLIEMCQK
jgi:hypothetical protein